MEVSYIHSCILLSKMHREKTLQKYIALFSPNKLNSGVSDRNMIEVHITIEKPNKIIMK